jgi:hypothetical protein
MAFQEETLRRAGFSLPTYPLSAVLEKPRSVHYIGEGQTGGTPLAHEAQRHSKHQE